MIKVDEFSSLLLDTKLVGRDVSCLAIDESKAEEFRIQDCQLRGVLCAIARLGLDDKTNLQFANWKIGQCNFAPVAAEHDVSILINHRPFESCLGSVQQAVLVP